MQGIDWYQRCVHDSGYQYESSTGSLADTYDGDTDTNWYYYARQYGAGTTYGWLQSIAQWYKPVTITSIWAKATAHGYAWSGASRNQAGSTVRAYVYYSAAWHCVWSKSSAGEPTDSAFNSYNYFADNSAGGEVDGTGAYGLIAAPWSGVTGVYVEVYGYALQEGGGGGQYSDGYIYECKAYGEGSSVMII